MADASNLAPLAPYEALAARVGASAADPRVIEMVEGASRAFRGAVRHQITHVTDDVIVLNGSGARDLRLPVAYLTDVSRVEIDGRDIEVEWDEFGLLNRADGGLWPKRRRCVTVTCSHGFDPVPDDIVEAVLSDAATAYNAVPGVSSKQVGGITVTYEKVAAGKSQAWVDAVDRYAIRRGDRA